MVIRNVKLIFSTNVLILSCSVITSLLGAWALGAEGRGDLALITMWPHLCMLFVSFGLPHAHRYWAARAPERISELFSNTIIFTLIAGCLTIGLAELSIPHFVGERSPEVMWMLRLFLLNIPLILLFELLRGLLEGARRFGWLGAARLIFFCVQAGGYLVLWMGGWLTVKSAVVILAAGQIVATSLVLIAAWIELRPRWHLSRSVWRDELHYGLRGYPGMITEYTILRLDQLMLAGVASSFIIGLYAVAVALSEITSTLASSVADAMMPEVAASAQSTETVQMLAKSLRLTIYAHLLALIPFWFAAPFILRVIYGESFAAATGTLRLLLLASVVWSAGTIVISGLNGFGYPGLATVARVASALMTLGALLLLIPRWGMMGAATASLIGYSVMLCVALFWLAQRQNSLWDSLRPRRTDINFARLKQFFKSPFAPPRRLEF